MYSSESYLVSGRVVDLLDTVKQDYESILRDSIALRKQRDEAVTKCAFLAVPRARRC
jgi:hypothetical protein